MQKFNNGVRSRMRDLRAASSLDDMSDEFPFEHPYYWSGFAVWQG